MDLDRGEIHNKGRLKGWALKLRLFWALKWQQAQRVPFGPKKVEKWISPHPNPYIQPHINNRYIGNFMDKRKETRERQEISGPIQRWFIIRG
jgi:hypothetical protein